MIPIETRLIRAIQDRLKEVADEELKVCEQRIRSRMAEFVSGTIIQLMEYVKIDRMDREIILRIEMPKEKTDGHKVN